MAAGLGFDGDKEYNKFSTVDPLKIEAATDPSAFLVAWNKSV